MTKLKNSNCEKTFKKNFSCNKTQNSICDKTEIAKQLNLNSNITQKLKL